MEASLAAGGKINLLKAKSRRLFIIYSYLQKDAEVPGQKSVQRGSHSVPFCLGTKIFSADR